MWDHIHVTQKYLLKTISLKPLEHSFITFVHTPSMTLFQYFNSIGGLMGLWNGASVLSLVLSLLQLLRIALFKFIQFTMQYSFILQLIQLITKFFKRIFHKTNIKVNVNLLLI